MGAYRTVSLSGVNSNEIYSLHYPDSLLRFCTFDFSNFIRRCTEFCLKCEETGEYKIEDAVILRNSISACHRFYEVNVHGIYEKIILDFFIEYICRERDIGTATLWNKFINAKNSFQKAVFARLTEYRHNKAVNQWVNLLKLQEYANRKLDFVFGEKADVHTAAAKRDYFDLTFSIAANEMGYPMNDFAAAKVYTVGRLPSSPFITGAAAKEIAKTTLSQLDYTESEKRGFRQSHSDNEAMDVFSCIKGLIPRKTDTVLNMVIKTMRSMPKKVYVSESLKSIIDLEIDLLLESGAVLQHCERCGEYFLRDADYNNDYCSRVQSGGKTCYEMSYVKPMRSREELQQLDEMASELYTYMSGRINIDLTQRDFAEWYQYFMTIKENIAHHNVSIEEFKDFVTYSRELRFNPPQPPRVPEKEEEDDAEEERVKPFVFERVDRSVLYEQERKRRRRERREEEERAAREAAQTIAQEPKAPVKVMKAENAPQTGYSVFSNPFDGAFDSGIEKLENEVRSFDFKPLDSIFSFGEDKDDEPAYKDAFVSYEQPEPKTSEPLAEEYVSEDDESGFDKEMAVASYAKKGTRLNYAANMYKKSSMAGETVQSATTFPMPVGGKITDEDFDILPSVPDDIIEFSVSEPTKEDTSAPSEIAHGEGRHTTSKTQRVRDRILSPVKNHNPFIDEE